jgi:diguanylate cyclase (GGDEF)-like protein
MTGDPAPRDEYLARMCEGLVDASADAYIVLDEAGTIHWANRQCETLFGLEPSDFLGRNMVEFLAPTSLQTVLEVFADYARPDRPDTGPVGPPMSVDLALPDGSVKTADAFLVPTAPGTMALPGASRLFVVRLDLRGTDSALYRAIELVVAEAPLEEIMAALVELVERESPFSVPVIGWNARGGRFLSRCAADGAPLVGDDALPSALGRSVPWRALGQRAFGFVDLHGDDATPESVHPALAHAAADAGVFACWSMALSTDEHDEVDAVLVVWRRAAGHPPANVTRRLERIGGIATLALRSARARRDLEHAARTDPLTGLANRMALTEHLAELDTHRSRPVVGACFCDLDDFKIVNDVHGHVIGDHVLVAAADLVRQQVRADHFVARAGGDEFVVVCEVDDADEVRILAERIVDAFGDVLVVDGVEVAVQVSVGWTSSNLGAAGVGLRAEQLVERADRALLQAKSAGKRQAVKF